MGRNQVSFKAYIKSITQFVYNSIKRLAEHNSSATHLSVSFCVGVYIGFSPFPGFQTLLVIVLSWLCSLYMPAVFIGSCLVNNPWTMVPVYMIDYFFGKWILLSVVHSDIYYTNPSWIVSINSFLVTTLGITKLGISEVSFWAFIIGGNLLGLIVAVILYPIMYRVFEFFEKKRFAKKNKKI